MAGTMGVIHLVLSMLLGVASVVYGHGNHKHVQTDHGTGADGKQNTAFQNSNIVRDTEHIKEHLSEKINQDKVNEMAPEELNFQFFVSHDLNGDKTLDGLEVYKSLEHALSEDGMPTPQERDKFTKKVMDETDDVLSQQDLNNDGSLDYREFVIGHKNAQPETTTTREL